MAQSTTPILLTAGMMYANDVLFQKNPQNPGSALKIPLAGVVAAVLLAGLEQVPGMAPIAVGIAWTAFITAFVAPINGKPSVAQNLINITGFGKG